MVHSTFSQVLPISIHHVTKVWVFSTGNGKLASWKIGLLENWPPRYLWGVENWPPLVIYSGPNVYTSLILLKSALHSSH